MKKAIYLHIGNNYSVDMRDVVGIFDMDNTTVTGITKKLLDRAEREKKVYSLRQVRLKSGSRREAVCSGDRIRGGDQ